MKSTVSILIQLTITIVALSSCRTSKTYDFGNEYRVTLSDGGYYVGDSEGIGLGAHGYRVFKVLKLRQKEAYLILYTDTFTIKPEEINIGILDPLYEADGTIAVGPYDMYGMVYNAKPVYLQSGRVSSDEINLIKQARRSNSDNH